MSATFHFLAHHPEVLRKAVNELQSTFSGENEVTIGAILESCKYLQACINEAMRMTPSVPNPLPRFVLPEGTAVDDEWIPAGTIIGASQYAVYRNPEQFREPDRFLPERWLENERDFEGMENKEQSQHTFLPFGSGPRTCVGWKLAWWETNLTIARTLLQYDWRPEHGEALCHGLVCSGDCSYPLKGYAVSVVEGPYLRFKRRG